MFLVFVLEPCPSRVCFNEPSTYNNKSTGVEPVVKNLAAKNMLETVSLMTNKVIEEYLLSLPPSKDCNPLK